MTGAEDRLAWPAVNRHEFLRRLHEVVAPRTYVEIGVNDGRGLSLSRVPTVGVDPSPQITSELRCDLHLVRATSDELFARERPLEHLGDQVDLAFIDGMHLFEYALRDFINVERLSDWSTIVVFDDVLPRNGAEAGRRRTTTAWAGDVYKIIPVLERYRPDLRFVAVDTEPTGMLVVFGADRQNAVLRERYDEIIREYLTADPQDVPGGILERSIAIPGQRLLDAPLWQTLIDARAAGTGADGRDRLLADVDALVGARADRRPEPWRPDPGADRVPEADPMTAAALARKPARPLWARAIARARRLLRG